MRKNTDYFKTRFIRGLSCMSKINRMSYELTHSRNFMNKLDEVFKWLESKNLRVHLSRYSRYKSYIDDFYKNGNKNDLHDLEQKFKKLNDSVQECVQIVQVYDAFKNENSCGFNERLHKIISGVDFYNPENKSDQARDFLYELLVASWFKKWGYDIDFEQITDVVAKKDGITVYVECKRIKSINGLEENFRKACKQLSKINDPTEHYGLVFIDIYNCVADYIRDYEYSSIVDMKKELNDVLENNFRKKNANLIEKILTKNLDYTLGVAFTTVRCLWLENITPQFYQDYKVITSSRITNLNYEILEKILYS
ncbi:TPA: hypothetical protein KRA30_001935 [Clostridioides difficile]|nr:hypothetical protein [Clostridioides difficile]